MKSALITLASIVAIFALLVFTAHSCANRNGDNGIVAIDGIGAVTICGEVVTINPDELNNPKLADFLEVSRKECAKYE